jgi:AcrR family transcriptional regulator
MSRPIGRRNADYTQERQNLIERLRPALLRPGGAELSFRELAAAAEVSPATLRHYFGSREQLLAEFMVELRRIGLPYLLAAATQPIDGVRESLDWLLRQIVKGWTFGVGAIHTLGLTAGLGHDKLGPSYINEVLEPTLQAAEARIARHVSTGELEACDLRHAALELLAPLLLGLLHQNNLHGAGCRPLDLEAFLRDHLDRFLRAYGAVKRGTADPTSSRQRREV